MIAISICTTVTITTHKVSTCLIYYFIDTLCNLYTCVIYKYRPFLEKGSDQLIVNRSLDIVSIECHSQLIRILFEGRPVMYRGISEKGSGDVRSVV